MIELKKKIIIIMKKKPPTPCDREWAYLGMRPHGAIVMDKSSQHDHRFPLTGSI